jgi:plastocyanin
VGNLLKAITATGLAIVLCLTNIFITGCATKEVTTTITQTVSQEAKITTTAASNSSAIIINITSAYADPRVVQGKSFIWFNRDNKIHTVTNEEDGPTFVFVLAPGQSVQYDFGNFKGVYRYLCALHPNETAELIVN